MTLDFVQEYRAGQAAEHLRQSVAVRGQVLREGKALEIPLAEMVPGDIALLAAGDLVPCDGRVLEAKDFFVNQALLTGEPFPVEKAPGESPGEPDILTAGNTVLLGTLTGTLTEARIHLERHMDPLGRECDRVLELAYFNSFFETGLKRPLDIAVLEHQEGT